MAIQYNENIHIAAPNPLDRRYLSLRTLAGSQLPYSAVTEVNNIIPITERYSGLTVNINGEDYWYKSGVNDNNLIIKSADFSSFSGYTGYTAPNSFLKLKQDNFSGQTVTGSQPIFAEGIIIGENPTQSHISGHTNGRIYYDKLYKTITADINDKVSLQLGQEDVKFVYNSSTGTTIFDGAAVYENGTYDGGGVNAEVMTVGLAIASDEIKYVVAGIATEEIPPLSYGFINTRGYLHNINTLTSSMYSGITVGSKLYLSATNYGEVSNIVPTPPNHTVELGSLLKKDILNGKIYVDINIHPHLHGLSDVSVPNPLIDEVLKWNGFQWTSGSVGSVSASAGVNFYNSTPILKSVTAPFGINSTGQGNGVQIGSLSKVPVVTGTTKYFTGQTASNTSAINAWIYDLPINKTYFDSGIWKFGQYLAVDSAVGDTYLLRQVYTIIDITGSTITTTGTSPNLRTATITSGQFTGMYFSANTINTNSSWLRTPSGIYQISAKTSNNVVKIVVPSTYVNENNVNGSIWNKLFGVSTPTIESVFPTFTYYEIISAQPEFPILNTSKLGQMGFVRNLSSTRTIYGAYNNDIYVSFFSTPLITPHNDLSGIQGGSSTQRYHIDLDKYTVIQNTSGVNTGDETKLSIENKLIGEITSHYHPFSGLTNVPNYTLQSNFNSHTGNSSIHFCQSQININESQVTNLVNDLNSKSNTGHTHSYTGSTIINKPTFVGCGGTSIILNNNTYNIHSIDAYSCLSNLSTKIGCNSLPFNLGSSNNTSVGIYNLTGNTVGSNNVALGNYALNKNTSGCRNVGVGTCSLSANTTGGGNTAIGINSLAKNTTGNANTSIGLNNMCGNSTGSNNTAIGNSVLRQNSTGIGNIGIGTSVLNLLTKGCSNIGVGSSTLFNLISGNTNLGIGCRAGNSVVTGNTNIFIGHCAGYNETGSGKLYIGSGNTSLIMGDMVQNCVILPKLKLRCTPTIGTNNDLMLGWNPTTCEIITCGTMGQFSNTGHTHSYTGNTIINKPTFVGSGDTIVQTVNNEVRIYSNSSSSTIFTENLYVSIASGKTFGKYVNGDTIPSSGKTFADVIKMALNEALAPTLTLNASGSDVSFGQPSKTVNISFSYTINTLNAHVTSVSLEWRRNSEGSWNTLPITTASTSYYHTIDDSTHRFSATTMNYRYTVTDNLGGTNTVYSNVTPAQYAPPTMSPIYTGTIVSPETQSIRELGNVISTIAGTITSNRSLVNITRYVVERSVNGAAYTTIQDIAVYGTSITISSYVDSSASGSATSIAYRLTVYDEYTTTVGSVYTITFRSMSYFGYNSNTTLTSAQIIALGNTASLASRARTVTNVTSGAGNYTYITYPAAYGDLTSIKLGGVEEVIGAWSKLTNVNVTNSHSQIVSYNVYRSNATNAYTNETLAIL